MSDNIVEFRPVLVGDGAAVDADNVLTHALGKLDAVVVVGLTPDGELYVADSHGSMETVFLMERAKLMLVQNEVARL